MIQEDQIEIKTKRKKSIRHWIFRAFIFVILVLGISFFAFKLPVVQRWSLNKINNNLSEKLKRTTIVGSLDLDVFDGVVLNDIFIEKETNLDTLVYIKEFSVSLRESLISLLQDEILINEVNLRHAYVNNSKSINTESSDFELFLTAIKNSFTSSRDENTGEAFYVGVKRINLENLNYVYFDDSTGESLKASLSEGHIVINTLDIVDGYFGLEEVVLNKPKVYLSKIAINQSSFGSTKVIEKENIELDSPNGIDDIFNGECFYSSIDLIHINDGLLILNNPNLDGSDIIYNDINLSINGFYLNSEPELGFVLNDFKVKGENINIHKFQISNVQVDDKRIVVDKMILKTDESDIGNSIKVKYRSVDELLSFSEKVFFDVALEPSKISIDEILNFLPNMVDLPVFQKNKSSEIFFNGTLKGRKNRINLRDLDLRLGDQLYFKGEVAIKNAFDESENLYNITIKKLLTSVNELESLIPGFQAPTNFKLLGKLDYEGRLDGYMKDFVSYGELKTDLGRAALDMRLDMKESVRDAQYSGEMEVFDFDLESWSGNNDFGKISFVAQVKEGRGLEKDYAHAILSATISKAGFKDYLYTNINFDGELDKNKILGALNIDDENIMFDFDGNFEFLEDEKLMDFRLVVERMNLKDLNLSSEDMALSGQVDVDFKGSNVEDVIGSLYATKLTIRKGIDVFLFDTASLAIKPLPGSRKEINFYSDIADVNFKGKYKVGELHTIFQHITYKNFPSYYELFNIKKPKYELSEHQHFNYSYDVKDTKKYLALVGQDSMRIIGAKGGGGMDTEQQTVDFNLSLPSFDFKSNSIKNISINSKIVGDMALMNIGIDSVTMNGKLMDPLTFNVKINKDTLNWNFIGGQLFDSIGIVDIGGEITPREQGVDFSVFENKLQFLGSDWTFGENLGYLSKEYIEVNNFVLTDGNRKIRIDDIRNKGVKMNLSNIELGAFNTMINNDKMDFFGIIDLTLTYDNLFQKGNTFVYLDIEDFYINEDFYGVVSSTFSLPKDKPIIGNLELVEGILNLNADIYYDRNIDSLEVVAFGDELRMDIFEILIPEGVSEIEGTVNVEARLYGKIDELKLNGSGVVNNFKGKVDYLGTYYTASNQKFSSDRYYLDLNGLELLDGNGNKANVTGGFRHDFFNKMFIDLDISSNNFIVLNTTKKDNPYYYGYGVGKVDARFRGKLDHTDMIVDVVANVGSELSLPVHSVQSNLDASFIEFVNLKDGKEVVDTVLNDFELSGLDLELKLALTNDATVSIIFDERLGDVIKGVGIGELQIYSRRNGDFNIYGNYTIDAGEYRFTAFNGLITKPFIVNKGSRLNWTGDPVNADINIHAHYDGLRVSMHEFLYEYISNYDNSELENEARNKTEVDLTVNLLGSLFKPDITFDVEFPNLTGVLKSFATSKTNSLKKNETLFNQQVASLIVTQRFLDDNNVGNGILSVDTGINTLSEFVTGQFSDILSGFLDEAVSNSIWADIDVDLGISKRSSNLPISNNKYLPNEVEIHVKNKFKFLDERFSFDFGGNYFKDEITNNGNLLIGDFEGSYYLTPERNLKARMYFKYDYEAIGEKQNRRTKLGLGIVYEYEFGKMIHLPEIKVNEKGPHLHEENQDEVKANTGNKNETSSKKK